jgi:RNA polymerase sigma factor (sigma-70 family)
MPKPLTREQVEVAFRLIEKGGPEGEEARAQFIDSNQRLVGKVASPHRDKGLSWDELLSAGNAGLLKAIAKFDPNRGLKLSTCAVPWIKGEITQAFKDAKRDKASDRNIRQTEHGVPLVFDREAEQKRTEDEALQNIAAKDLESQEESESEELVDHDDLQEAVEADGECGGLGLNATQARSEGYGPSAGCPAWDKVDDEAPLKDPTSDGKPGGGLAINFAADQTIGAMGIDSDLIPALEEAIEHVTDQRQALILRMHLGLGGHKRHTFREIGDALDISGSRAEAIFKATFAQLRNDPTLQMLFDLNQ